MLKELLKSNNIVATKQRLEILGILHNEDIFLSAYEIEDKTSDLDISTIYRTLSYFESKRILSKQYFSEENLFKYKFSEQNHYHQLVCLKCHKVINIDYCPMNMFDQSEVKAHKFKLTDYKFELYGYCAHCQA